MIIQLLVHIVPNHQICLKTPCCQLKIIDQWQMAKLWHRWKVSFSSTHTLLSQGRRQYGFDWFGQTHQILEIGSWTYQSLWNLLQTMLFFQNYLVRIRYVSSVKKVTNQSIKNHGDATELYNSTQVIGFSTAPPKVTIVRFLHKR